MTERHRIREACACCSSDKLNKVFRLPATPLANEFVTESEVGEYQDVFPLDLLLCEYCGHLQVEVLVDPQRLFKNYVYVTGTSPVTVAHFADYAATIKSRFLKDKANPFVVEIGSNDGTLLRQFTNARVLGIDPAVSIAEAALSSGVPTVCEFFSSELAYGIEHERGNADVVIANNVFAHAADLQDIVLGVRRLIGSSGVFVFEVAYLLDVVENLLFDTIYHEHYSHHAVTPLQHLLERLGLKIFDVERSTGQLGRGSIRVYAASESSSFEVQPSVEKAIAREMGLFEPRLYTDFRARVDALGTRLRNRLLDLKSSGVRIAGYGAPAKLTTLMYTFGLERDLIDFVVDDSTWKQGLYTPGLHIPVVAPQELHTRNPGACVVFAWNFAESIMAKHSSYKGKFIVPLPELREIG